MPLRLIEIFASADDVDAIAALAEEFESLNFWKETAAAAKDATVTCRIVARPEKQQELIDRLQAALGKEKPWRIVIMPIEATIPELEREEKNISRAGDTRGALRRD
jgi:hypothetical protein